MIHTFEVFRELSKDEFEYILDMHKIKNKKYYDFTNNIKINGVVAYIKKISNIGKWKLTIFIDAVKLLNKSIIVEADMEAILSIVNFISNSILGYPGDIILNRIDYRFDKVIIDKDIRELIMKLYNKNENRKAHMKKVSVFNKNTKKSNRKTSIRYVNKSRCCNVYDKEEERKFKGEAILNYENNVLRYEVQVKRNHIRYLKRNYSIPDRFEEYFTKEKYNHFMEKNIIAAYGKSDYYNLYYARKKIYESNLNEKYKEELINFLKETAIKKGLTKSKKSYTYYKYRKFIKQLNELNIHPIIIEKSNSIKKLENPIKNILL